MSQGTQDPTQPQMTPQDPAVQQPPQAMPAGQGYEPAVLNISNEQGADTKEIVLMPSHSGVVLGLLDSKDNVIGEDQKAGKSGLIRSEDPMPVINVADGREVELDLKHGAQSAAKGIYLTTQDGAGWLGSKPSRIVLEHFTGSPPIQVGEKSNVAIKDAAEFMGFKAGPAVDGKPGATSAKVTFQREADGSVSVMRDGKPAINVPKNTKVDILDKNGKPLFTIDSSMDVDKLAEAYKEAEKKAFAEYQASSPDQGMKNAAFRSGSEPPPPVPETPAQQEPTWYSKMGADIGNQLTQISQQAGEAAKTQVLKAGTSALTGLPPVPTGPGTGTGR